MKDKLIGTAYVNIIKDSEGKIMLDNKTFEKRRKLVVESIKNIKRKRPIQNQD